MQEELKWFATSIGKLEKFRGKHVAIVGEKVVASGDSAIDVLEKAKKEFPTKRPVLAFVPKEETLILELKWNSHIKEKNQNYLERFLDPLLNLK